MFQLARRLLTTLIIGSLLIPSFHPVLASTDSASSTTSATTNSTSTPATTDITNQTDSTTTTLLAPTTDTTTTLATPTVDATVTPVDPTATIDPAATTKSDQAILDKIKKAKNKDQGTVSTLAATATNSTSSNSTTNKTIQDKLKLQADTATGALTFSYPLITPPGRSGLQPDLNLSYTSQAVDNGNILGYGWSLNIPAIERLNKQGIDKLYTTNSFVSALSGEILPVTLTDTTHGTYGSRIDNGEFVKYQFNTDNSWTVTTKTGLVYQFGSTTLTRQDDPVDATRIYKWLLAEIRDQNGNYVKYDYTKDNGQIYPSQISYTHNFNTTTNVTNLGIFSVNFIKELRTDTNYSFSTGFAVKTNYRLSEVQIKTNNVLTKKYQLTYTTGDNSVRSLLNSVIETGYDESGVEITLPATKFNYQPSSTSWTLNNSLAVPVTFKGTCNASDDNVQILDVNGDGLVDLVPAYNYCSQTPAVFLNNGNGWQKDISWTLPLTVINPNNFNGIRWLDINGDNLPDIVFSKLWLSQSMGTTYTSNEKHIYLNNGNGWVENFNWAIPVYLVENEVADGGVRIVDVNDDNLPDIVYANIARATKKVFINTGSSWVYNVNWNIPVYFSNAFNQYNGAELVDVNGDGLADILFANQSSQLKQVYLNTGTNWVLDTTWGAIPQYFTDRSSQLLDINSDGLTDIVYTRILSPNVTEQHVYLNNGKGWTENPQIVLPFIFTNGSNNSDTGGRVLDIFGKQLLDIIDSHRESTTLIKNIYLNSGKKPDSLISVTYPTTGSTTITYKPSAQYQSTTNISTTNPAGLLNPKLPFILQTVNQITTNDNTNVNPNQTTTYTYQDGQYYFDQTNITNRKFSGFGQIVQTDSQNNQTKTFYHQGNASNSTQGEYLDNEAKIGKVYRTEIYDNQNKLYQKSINKWDSVQLNPAETDKAKQRSFVKLIQTVEQDYDGQVTHKDKALEYQYDNSTGNQTKVISYGEVTASDDGTFVDVGTDKLTTDTTYASNPTKYLIGLPAQETTTDQTLTKIKETKYYYDNLALNIVNLGNLTKQENWLTGATYLTSQNSYDSYGNVLTQTDPKNFATTYTYDSYNLYPKTITNALNQAINFSYNYNLGKVNQTTDPNNAITKTTYDGLGRVAKEEQTDINPVTNPTSNPAILVIKTVYSYNDTTFPNSIKKTDYLDTINSVDSYTYLDGLSRPIQTKTEAETANTFSTKDFIYNSIGLLDKESLPYSSTGISYLPPLAGGVGGVLLHPTLFTTYTYDPLQRVITATNSTGTTTNAYTNWRVSTTDQNNNQKTFTKDAYDNLIKTEEYYAPSSQNSAASTTVYTTNYQYNSLNNLIKITDASGNVRNFVYDNLGRQTKAEDLHNPTDTTFGVINYQYDNNSNLTSKIDANNQTTNYTYDNLNRKLTEDNTNQAGVEVNNVYDNCLNGVGRLCSTTNTKLGSTQITTDVYEYNLLGLVKTDSQTITDSSGVQNNTTVYTYNRQGNQTQNVYPDNSEVNTTYNSAGQLETTTPSNTITGLPATAKLKGFWSFDEGSGTIAYDQSGNNNTGTLINGQTDNWVTGINGQALDFDGINDYLSIPTNNTLNFTNNLSITAWVNLAALNSTQIITAKGNTTGNRNWILAVTANGHLHFNADGLASGNDGFAIWSNNDYDIQPNQNYFIAATYDSANLKLYINGQEVKSKAIADTLKINNDQIYIANNVDNLHFNGVIDEVRLYDVPLTSTQIHTLYVNPTSNKTITNVTQTDYNPLGQIILQKYGNGTQTVYTYDENKLYRLINKTTTNIATGTKLQDLTYTYDNVGNIIQIIDASPTILAKTTTYQYDSLYRLTQTTTTNSANGQNYTQTYTYDPIGNITYKSDQGAYQYNGNQGSNYANPNAVTAIQPTNLIYEGTENFSDWDNAVRYVNGGSVITNSTDTAHTGTSSLKAAGSLYNGARLIKTNLTVGQTVTFTGYLKATADNGNPIYIRTNGTEQNDWNQTQLLPNGAWQQFTVTGIINYTSVDFNVFQINSTTPLYLDDVKIFYGQPSDNPVTKTFTYDNNGNLISDGTWTHTWDYNNRLVKSTNGTKTITYTYDSNGNRVSKSDGVGTTYYINQYYEIENGNVKKNIFAGNEKVATIENNNTYYHHTDHLTGSNIETDQNGIGVELTDYYPFGSVRVDSKSGSYSNDYKFTGKELDVDTDLYYYGARYYDGKIGRFVGEDNAFWAVGTPALKQITGLSLQQYLSDPQNFNSYSYVKNNPLKYTDPDGQFFLPLIAYAVAYAPVWVPAVITGISAVGAAIASYNYGEMLGHYSTGNTAQAEASAGKVFNTLAATEAGVAGAVGAGEMLIQKANQSNTNQPKLLNPPIIKDSARMNNHVIPRHVDPNIKLEKSKFNQGVDLNQLLDSATQQPMTQSENGNYVRTFNTGQNIGIDKNTGKQTSTATVVTYPNNKINTMHPGSPNKKP